MMHQLFSVSAIDKLIADLLPMGYKYTEVSPGVLGYGHVLLLSPSERFYSFEIIETALNGWSSVHKVRRFTRISRRIQSMLDSVSEEV